MSCIVPLLAAIESDWISPKLLRRPRQTDDINNANFVDDKGTT